jgi:hypothetical protein
MVFCQTTTISNNFYTKVNYATVPGPMTLEWISEQGSPIAK